MVGLLEPEGALQCLEKIQTLAAEIYGRRLEVHTANDGNHEFKTFYEEDISGCNSLISNCDHQTPQVVRAIVTSSVSNATKSLLNMYRKGVRYFYFCEMNPMKSYFKVIIEDNNLTDVLIDTTLRPPDAAWNASPFSIKYQEVLIESLIAGYGHKLILPVLTTHNRWVESVLQNILKKQQKQMIKPLFFHENQNRNDFLNKLKAKIDFMKREVVVVLSVGNYLQLILSNNDITKALFGSMVVIHSQWSDLQSLEGDQKSSENAGKLHLITSIFSRNENIHSSKNNKKLERNKFHSVSPKSKTIIDSYFILLKTASKNKATTKFPDTIKENQVSPTESYKTENLLRKGLRINLYRMVFMSRQMENIWYALNQPWLIEEKFTVTFTKGYYNVTKTAVAHNMISLNTIMTDDTWDRNRSCVNELIRGEIHNYLSGSVHNMTILMKLSDIIIIPKLYGIGVRFFRTCQNDRRVTIDLVDCGFTGIQDHIHCQHVINGKHPRTGRSVAIGSLHQQIISSLNYDTLKKRYYGKTRNQKEKRLLDRSFYSLESYTMKDRWENFKSVVPQMLGCFGSTGGCSFCFFIILYSELHVNPGVCMGACGVAVGGSCTAMLAAGILRTMHQTLICTELYRQGYMSFESYLADASFGYKLNKTHPETYHVYRAVARQIVQLMRISPTFTRMVCILSEPWREHMEFSEGLRNRDNLIGRTMMQWALFIFPLFYRLRASIALIVKSLSIILACVFLIKTKRGR